MRMIASLFCFLLVCLIVPALSEPAETPTALELVQDFTQYSIYFAEKSSESSQCAPNDVFNLTHIAFTRSIDRCPDKRYSPRFLSTSQISWKISNKKTNAEQRGGANSIDTEDASKNLTTSDGGNDTVVEEKKSREIIHKYLAFALLLPKHPFSTDLLESLVSAGPMFPSVTIVSGNGYDFKDMCRQYAVRSFPQLFFFKDGLLAGTYDGSHTIPEVASRLAKWTNSLPRALPLAPSKSVTDGSYGYSQYPLERTLFLAPESELFSLSLFGWNITAKVPYVTEPIAGSMEYLAQYDVLIFIAAGCFALGRLLFFLWTRKRTAATAI